jgi:hypothetical protein
MRAYICRYQYVEGCQKHSNNNILNNPYTLLYK